MAIIDELRAATKQTHLDLDHAVYPLIQQVKSAGDYAKLLRTFYGFFQPLYTRFDQWLNDELVKQYYQRRRPEWILQDLEAIGAVSTGLAVCDQAPVLSNKSEAFGAYYVLEGSTMGGSIISKKIGENLSIHDGNGLRFFNGYGDNNRTMWNDFLISLEKDEDNQRNPAAIIDAAQQTFQSFKSWIMQQYA